MEETIQLFLDPRYGVKPSQVRPALAEGRLLCCPAPWPALLQAALLSSPVDFPRTTPLCYFRRWARSQTPWCAPLSSSSCPLPRWAERGSTGLAAWDNHTQHFQPAPVCAQRASLGDALIPGRCTCTPAKCTASPPLHVQEQGPALDELKRMVTRLHPDLKDAKAAFWKRRTSVLKVHGVCGVGSWSLEAASGSCSLHWAVQRAVAGQCARQLHCSMLLRALRLGNPRTVACFRSPLSVPQVHMLLLAHLAREEIPAALQRDLHFLLTKGLPMLQEMLALATAPRVKVGRTSPVSLCLSLIYCR